MIRLRNVSNRSKSHKAGCFGCVVRARFAHPRMQFAGEVAGRHDFLAATTVVSCALRSNCSKRFWKTTSPENEVSCWSSNRRAGKA